MDDKLTIIVPEPRPPLIIWAYWENAAEEEIEFKKAA